MAVSIIILNYKSEKLTIDCVKSVLCSDYANDSFEIILLDNNSTNDSYSLLSKELNGYKNITILKSEKNLGFSGGCNLGIMASRGEYIILLNNDTLVPRDWLTKMVEYARSNKDIGIIGTKILFSSKNNLINNAGSYLTSKGDGGDIGFKQKDLGQYDHPKEVFSICCANMLIKRELLSEAGLLDNRFFMYYEDTDLCYRARLMGYKILYVPDPAILHCHAASLGEWSPLFTFYVLRNKLFVHMKNSNTKVLANVLFGYVKQLLNESLILKVNGKIHLKVIFSLIKNLPYLLYSRAKTRLFLKKVDDRSVYGFMERLPRKIMHNKEVKEIVIYNRYLDTLGGGELSSILTAKALEKLFPNAMIRIVTFDLDKKRWGKFNVISKTNLESAFNIPLDRVLVNRIKTWIQPFMNYISNRTNDESNLMYRFFFIMHRIFLHLQLKRISRKCDIFINHSYNDEFVPGANVNLYFCMFPHIPKKPYFALNYNKVLVNSEFTLKHTNKRWSCKGEILYPYAIQDIPPYRSFIYRDNLIVSTGRYFKEGHNKRQDIIIKVFKMLKDKYDIDEWKIIFIGRCTEKDRDYLEELKEQGKGYNIEFLVNLPESEKESLIEKSKIYVHAAGYDLSEEESPECMEHFGISVLEAKARGVVPIVLDKGGLKELVVDGVDGFKFETIEDCAEKIYRCIKNPELLQELSLKAYNQTVQGFKFENFSESLKTALHDQFTWE